MQHRSTGPFARLRALARLFSLAALACAPFAGCASYDPPPKPTLDVSTDGVLDDPKAPVIVHFSKPVDPMTLRVKIARYETDLEGNLPDEQGTDKTLDTLFVHDPYDGDLKGTSALENGGLDLRIQPSAALPIGPRLVLILEPGLASPGGLATEVRKKLLFGYRVKLDCNQPVANLTSGDFVFLVPVDEPIQTQIRLFATIRIDPATGKFIGQWTRAKRNPDRAHCPSDLSCKSTEVCRTMPAHACVIPSEPTGSVDEYPDLVPDLLPETGFSFTAEGCVADQADGSAALVNSPVDVRVTSPAVTLRNTILSAAFKLDGTGKEHGSGSLTAEEVFLGDISSGKGSGNLTALKLPPGASPPDIPPPPAAGP
jgi:hypothetical protein